MPIRIPYSLRLLEQRHLSQVDQCSSANRSEDRWRDRNAVVYRPYLSEDRHPLDLENML